jgi:predicted ATPase/DNA-binding SARP family transcriptional activator
MRPSVQVSVLGPLEVRVDGRDRRLPSPAQRRLLTALVLAEGRTVSLDALTQAVWGSEPPASARNSLQSQVARLRAIVGTQAIVTRPPGYALHPEVGVDAAEVGPELRAARSQLGSDPRAAVARLYALLGRWRGAAYAEHRDELATGAAQQLDDLRTEARLLLASGLLASGRADDALHELRALHAEDPARDDVVAVLATTLGTAGRTPDGLALLRSHRSWLADELGLDPGPRALAAEQRLLAADPSGGRGPVPADPAPLDAAPLDPPRRVPPPATVLGPTLGRTEERRTIVAALDTSWLVTLVGTGGVGKTHLARLCGAEVAAAADAPLAWVELSAVHRDEDVADAVADALGAPAVERTATAIATMLARFPGLVVLDNCEHVLGAVAELVELAAGQAGRRSTLLATSRQRLEVPGERVVRLAPLPVPSASDASGDDPAVALLQDRVVAAGGTPLHLEDAAAIVAAVDGLPLAIELAAARVVSLSAADVLTRLAQHLDVLGGSERRTPRHRSVRDVISWSYELLAADEQRLFQRLSVFAAGFALHDAEAVCSDDDVTPAQVTDGVARLVERSLLVATGHGRYRFLQPVRLFAAEQLAASPDHIATLARHTTWCLEVAARADRDLLTIAEREAIAAFDRSLPDLRVAHARASAGGDLDTVARLAARLYRVAYLRAQGDVLGWGDRLAASDREVDGPDWDRAVAAAVPAAVWRNRHDRARELAALLEPALASGELDPHTESTVVEAVADLALMEGELPRAVAAYERGVALGQQLEHPGLVSYARAGLALAHAYGGATAVARREAARALDEATTAGIDSARALAAYAVGEARADEDPPAAFAAYAESVAAARRVGARFLEGIARTAEVALLGRHGPPDEALARTHDALRLWHDAGADGMATTTLRNLVVLLARVGADEAALVVDAALARSATSPSYGDEARRHRLAVDAVRGRLPSERVQACTREGESLADLTALVGFALEATRQDGEVTDTSASSSAWPSA